MKQRIRQFAELTTDILTVSSLLWLTLMEVNTGWCEEMPMMLYTILGLGVVGTYRILLQRIICRICWLDVVIALWFLYITLNYWFVSPYPAGERYFSYLSSMLLYIVLRFSVSDKHKHIVLIALAIGGGYEAVLGLMQLLGWEYSRHSLFDVTGTFFNPGPYSGYIVVILSIVTAYFYKRRGLYIFPYFKKGMQLRRIYPTCIFILSSVVLYLSVIILPATWSRAAFVAYVAVLLALFYKRHKKWVVSLFCLAAIAGVFLYWVKADSANGRVLMNTISVRNMTEKPICGHGIGGFVQTFANGQAEYFKENPDSPFVEVAGSPEYAFNEWMAVGVEQGCIGILFFTVIAVGTCIILLRKRNEMAYGWIALLVFALFSYPFSLQPFRILAILFTAYAANSISKKEVKNKIRNKIPHLLLIAFALIVTYNIIPRVNHKVKTNQEWNMVSGYQHAAFADDYAGWYNTLADNPKFLFAYGKMLHEMKRYNDSNAALRDGLMVSSDPMFHVVMGNNYRALRAYKEAEESYKTAFDMGPNKMYPLYQLLQLYIELKNERDARKTAQRIVDFKPKIRSNATDEMQQFARNYLKDETIKE